MASAAASSDPAVMFQTKQGSTIKTLVEVVKDISPETNICMDSNGVRITAMDSGHVVLIRAILNAADFDHYVCNTDCYAGVDMGNLLRKLKNVSNDEVVTIDMKDKDSDRIILTVKNDQVTRVHEINLMDVDSDFFTRPQIDVLCRVHLESHLFQKIVRDHTSESDHFFIRIEKDTDLGASSGDLKMIFTSNSSKSVTSDKCTTTVKLPKTRSTGGAQDDEGGGCDDLDDSVFPLEVEYNLKFFSYFVKLTAVSPVVRLILGTVVATPTDDDSDEPVEVPPEDDDKHIVTIIEYDLNDLGKIDFVVAPRDEPSDV
jgi:proliferating cell nuclear antigen PCNA